MRPAWTVQRYPEGGICLHADGAELFRNPRHATDNDREARSLVPVAHCMGSKCWVDSATGRKTQELSVSVVTCNFSSKLE